MNTFRVILCCIALAFAALVLAYTCRACAQSKAQRAAIEAEFFRN